jgi:uncharacterized protein YcbX
MGAEAWRPSTLWPTGAGSGRGADRGRTPAAGGRHDAATMESVTGRGSKGRGPTVAWIAMTPVKGLRLQHRERVELTEAGVLGDRAFFLVDERGHLVNGKHLGPLLAVVADHDPEAGRLALRFPDGREVAARVELGTPLEVRFFGREMRARSVEGPFSAAISEHCGRALRLVATPPGRPGVDRGARGAVTLLSLASLERLRAEAGGADPVDPRRFRMTLGVDGLAAHEEDAWVGAEVRVGEAILRGEGHVGRCAVTTRNADTGAVDFETLRHLGSYRGSLRATEPLPFGIHLRVLRPGTVRLGDPIVVLRLGSPVR